MDIARGVISIAFIVLNTVFCASVIIILSLLRWFIPILAVKVQLGNWANNFNNLWVSANRLVLINVLRITHITQTWNTLEGLSKHQWYLIICNHQSWADILILQIFLMARIPTVKFFTKRQLLWIPFCGTAMWCLDYPYVYRFSREQLKRDPSLRGKDRQSIRDACWKFRQRPTSILNFLEGTRITQEKHESQGSPYTHLLSPKAGGLGYVCSELKNNLHQLLDVTIVYPENVPSFWDFLCGRTPQVLIDIKIEEIPQEYLTSELSTDAELQQSFKIWIDNFWQRKDRTIDRLLNSTNTAHDE